MLNEAQARVLTERFQRRLGVIRGNAGGRARDAWESLGAWDRADVARFAARVNPTLDAARRAALDVSAGYYDLLTDRRVPVPGVSAHHVSAPFEAYWAALRSGSLWVDAFSVGAARAAALGADTVTGASREVAARASVDGVVGWRRVLTGNSCKWCSDVAAQRYRSAESATFGHDHCDCIVVPIRGDVDPGQVINTRHLDQAAED